VKQTRARELAVRPLHLFQLSSVVLVCLRCSSAAHFGQANESRATDACWQWQRRQDQVPFLLGNSSLLVFLICTEGLPLCLLTPALCSMSNALSSVIRKVKSDKFNVATGTSPLSFSVYLFALCLSLSLSLSLFSVSFCLSLLSPAYVVYSCVSSLVRWYQHGELSSGASRRGG
jgi:hypothetical protein